jgi:hypothetical protein
MSLKRVGHRHFFKIKLITLVTIDLENFFLDGCVYNDQTDAKKSFGLKQSLLKKTMGVLKKTNLLFISNGHSGQTKRNYFILSTRMLFRISCKTRSMSNFCRTTNIRRLISSQTFKGVVFNNIFFKTLLITFFQIDLQNFLFITFVDNDLTDAKNLFGIKQSLLKKTMGVSKKTNLLEISIQPSQRPNTDN